MDIKTSMRFQDTHPQGLGIPTAIPIPHVESKQRQGRKQGRCRAAETGAVVLVEQKSLKKGGPWDGLVHFLEVWITLGSSVLAT